MAINPWADVLCDETEVKNSKQKHCWSTSEFSWILWLFNTVDFIFRLLTTKSNGYFLNFVKSKPSQVIKRNVSDVQNSVEKGVKSTLLQACSPWKLCTGVSLGLAARLLFNNSSALCKAQHSRVIQRRPNVTEDSSKFDWNRFFRYLVPHKWLLLAAVAVSRKSLYSCDILLRLQIS